MSHETIREDFDRLARLHADRPETPDRYESFLLARLPEPPGSVLDVGCGAGRLAREVARRGGRVTAIDASPEMIRLARARAGDATIEFLCGDFAVHPFDPGRYDVVLSVATLHHLPAPSALARMAGLLRPGGMLLVHDVRAPSGVLDWLASGFAAVANGDAVWWARHRWFEDRAIRAAWHAHGAKERYLTFAEARRLYGTALPGTRCRRHPLWRYTAVWIKPAVPA